MGFGPLGARGATGVAAMVLLATWPSPPPEARQQLTSTHAPMPQGSDPYWLVPGARERASVRAANLTAAANAYAAGNYAAALSDADRAVADEGALLDYALFYSGLSQLRMSHADEALKAFEAALDRKPQGYLPIAAMLAKAEALDVRGDHAAAADVLDKLTSQKTFAPEDVLSRLGRAALAAGDRRRAADAFQRVYDEFPLTDAATTAASTLATLQDQISHTSYKPDLGRALILFGAKRYAEARSAFQDLQKQVSGDDREVTDLRLAECDFFLRRYAAARDALQPYLEHASRRAEARFFHLSALRELGDQQFVSLTRALVTDVPGSSWSAEALNSLATYYILTDNDALAAETFKEIVDKFPNGEHTERAAWKYGWWAYKSGNFAETIRVFETTAANFPHSDYRPPFVYWAARAHGRQGDREAEDARMRLVYTDYMNSYYGRLAQKQLSVHRAAQAGGATGSLALPASERTLQAPAPPEPPPNTDAIKELLAANLYDDALNELRYAQRAWGTSPQIEATIAWAYHQQGDLRHAITVMRHAYPQHLAAGGEGLPTEILQVIFPLTYWDSIRRNAAARGLDPYVMAALINQESTFDPGAHSSANAWGLMQIVPSTGKRLARSLGIRRFSQSMLTNPDINIRLGALYFSRLIDQFGGTYYALASYNAGENRVIRWKADRPTLAEDEFIDDIPFPETQNYVKRILGQAEDYRRIYGQGDGTARPVIGRATAIRASAVHPASVAKPKITVKKKAAPKKSTRKKSRRRHR